MPIPHYSSSEHVAPIARHFLTSLRFNWCPIRCAPIIVDSVLGLQIVESASTVWVSICRCYDCHWPVAYNPFDSNCINERCWISNSSSFENNCELISIAWNWCNRRDSDNLKSNNLIFRILPIWRHRWVQIYGPRESRLASVSRIVNLTSEVVRLVNVQ